MKKTMKFSKRYKKNSLFLDGNTKYWERMLILSTLIYRFNGISMKTPAIGYKFEMDWGRGFTLIHQRLTLSDIDTDHEFTRFKTMLFWP